MYGVLRKSLSSLRYVFLFTWLGFQRIVFYFEVPAKPLKALS